MPFQYKDRILATSTTTGTGTLTVSLTPVTGYLGLAAITDTDTFRYLIYGVDTNGVPTGEWEIGVGAVGSSGASLTRPAVEQSSNANAAVNLSAGTKRIACLGFVSFEVAKLLNAPFNQLQVEIAITGAVTATIGRSHLCTGTSANYTVTLPAASGNAGRTISFRMGPIASLSKLVTLDGNSSETIDGILTRIMWAGETCTLYCDGSNWFKIAGKSIPMAFKATLAADQNLTAGIANVIGVDTLDATYIAPAAMWDSGNSRAKILRPSQYAISSFHFINGSGMTYSYIGNAINGVQSQGFNVIVSVVTGQYIIGAQHQTMLLAVNDVVNLCAQPDGAGTSIKALGAGLPSITIVETCMW